MAQHEPSDGQRFARWTPEEMTPERERMVQRIEFLLDGANRAETDGGLDGLGGYLEAERIRSTTPGDEFIEAPLMERTLNDYLRGVPELLGRQLYLYGSSYRESGIEGGREMWQRGRQLLVGLGSLEQMTEERESLFRHELFLAEDRGGLKHVVECFDFERGTSTTPGPGFIEVGTMEDLLDHHLGDHTELLGRQLCLYGHSYWLRGTKEGESMWARDGSCLP